MISHGQVPDLKYTRGRWTARLSRTLIHISGPDESVCSISISPPRVPEKEIRDRFIEAAYANAAVIALLPDLILAVQEAIGLAQDVDGPDSEHAQRWLAVLSSAKVEK